MWNHTLISIAQIAFQWHKLRKPCLNTVCMQYKALALECYVPSGLAPYIVYIPIGHLCITYILLKFNTFHFVREAPNYNYVFLSKYFLKSISQWLLQHQKFVVAGGFSPACHESTLTSLLLKTLNTSVWSSYGSCTPRGFSKWASLAEQGGFA